MRIQLLTLFALLFTLTGSAQHEGAKFEKIDSLLNYLYNNNKFMGAVAIQEKGQVVFEKAYGFSDVENRIMASPATKYKVGAVTKMFTSAIIFQLIEEKKLKLDTKLSEFFPKIKNAGKITIADMLNHKSGISNYTADAQFPAYRNKLQNRKDMVTRLESYDAAFEPGEKSDYSDSNYLLLGYIIQDITKKSYKDNVMDRVVKRAGLKNTYCFSKINSKKNEAYSYSFVNGKWAKADEWHESVIGASGALTSNASDMTIFIKALFDGKIIKKESLDIMTRTDMAYGSGIFAFPFIERKFFGHNGGIESFNTVVGYYPKDQLGFALLVNGDNYNYNDIVMGVLSCYYKLPYLFPNLNSAKIDEAILKNYEGIYSTPSLPFKVDIKLVNGTLIAHATDQGSFPLNPLSETVFNFDPAGITMTFTKKGFTLKQADGMITEFKKE